jgi:PEP-CTERM/exosortase A-associated glycosyltransferase
MSLHVLHVLDHSWPVLDGYAQRSRSIISAQVHLGMQPTVVTGPLHQIDDPAAVETTDGGVRYFRTFCPKGLAGHTIEANWPVLRELSVVKLFRKRIEVLLKNEPFDIVHAHSPALCGLAASLAANACNVPFVYELRAFWEDAAVEQGKTRQNSLRYRFAKNLETYVVRKADAVVGIARAILTDLENRGVSRDKLFYVSNGVDTSRFCPRDRDSELTTTLGLDGTVVLGFIGTMFWWENLAWLVRAAIALRRKGAAFKMVIVGDGSEAAEVRKVIQENDAASHIHFIGRVPHDQIARYYSVIDVMVYPRRSIRLTELVTPLKPLEAMALGKAVLGSDVGGIRELIEPEVTGILFKAGDAGDFESQAVRLLGSPELRQELGARARQKVAADKDWNTLARTYESVYAMATRESKIADGRT